MAPRALSHGHLSSSEDDRDHDAFPLSRRGGPASSRWIAHRSDEGAWSHDEEDDSNVSATERHRRALLHAASDRMRPQVAGGIAGFLGGLAALGLIQALAPMLMARPIEIAAAARGVDPRLAFGLAYVTAGASGALVGASFAALTKYLRRWFALAVWAEVFFVSLTMLVLAILGPGRGVATALVGPILAASAAYAFVVSFSLPIRRRR